MADPNETTHVIDRRTTPQRLVAFGETGHAGLIGVGGAILALLLLFVGVAGYSSLKGDVLSVQKSAATAQDAASKAQKTSEVVASDLADEVKARRAAVATLTQSLKDEVARLDARVDGVTGRVSRISKLVGKPTKAEKRSIIDRLAALEGDCDESPSEDDSKPADGATPPAK